MQNITLLAHDVHKSFIDGRTIHEVLHGISIECAQGELVGISGVSGSGKSTLLYLLGGLEAPTAGYVAYRGRDLNTFNRAEYEQFRAREVGFIFQFHYLVHELTITENVALAARVAGVAPNEATKKARDLLALVGLEQKERQYPSQLSGGQLQRASIARALINNPRFLLADEPTGNLDAENAALITDLIVKSAREYAMGVVLCSHDQSVVAQMNRVITLRDGIIIAS